MIYKKQDSKPLMLIVTGLCLFFEYTILTLVHIIIIQPIGLIIKLFGIKSLRPIVKSKLSYRISNPKRKINLYEQK